MSARRHNQGAVVSQRGPQLLNPRRVPYAGYSLALDFVNGLYRLGDTVTKNIATLNGYAQNAAPTITPGVGYVVGATDFVRILNTIPAPGGDFTFVAKALSPVADGTVKMAAGYGDGSATRNNLIELWRNNAGNCQRVYASFPTTNIIDNVTGVGTPIVATPAVASGEQMVIGAYREGGVLKPVLYGTKRTGTPAMALTTLDSVWIGYRVDNAIPFTGGTIQKIFLINRVLSDAEIAAL